VFESPLRVEGGRQLWVESRHDHCHLKLRPKSEVRMRSVSIITGAASLVVAATSVASPSDYSIRDTRRLVRDYARCVVGRHAVTASEALLRNVSNKVVLSQYGSLVDGACLVQNTHANAKMTFEGDLYRYALADALVTKELASSPVPDLSNVPKLERRALPDQPSPLPANATKTEKHRYEEALADFSEAETYRALDAFGECVVRMNTAGAKALLLTSPESAAENGAFAILRPTLPYCLPEGRTLTLGKLVLRGTVAVNYYRLAHAASAQATTGMSRKPR
jgi:hypothetical protein